FRVAELELAVPGAAEKRAASRLHHVLRSQPAAEAEWQVLFRHPLQPLTVVFAEFADDARIAVPQTLNEPLPIFIPAGHEQLQRELREEIHSTRASTKLAWLRREINFRSWSAVARHRFGFLRSMEPRDPKRCGATALQELDVSRTLISARAPATLSCSQATSLLLSSGPRQRTCRRPFPDPWTRMPGGASRRPGAGGSRNPLNTSCPPKITPATWPRWKNWFISSWNSRGKRPGSWPTPPS